MEGIYIFNDFIKHYNTIREILRDIFLYGCYSKEALENNNRGSLRKVNLEIRRIQQYIEKEFIKEERQGRNKLLNLSCDSISNTTNFLVNTYYSKSFTKCDITLYYYLLSILSNNNEMSLKEISDFLIDNNCIDLECVSEKTIERKLNELDSSMELITSYKNGKRKIYKLSNDILESLTNDEITRLYYIVALFKNISFPHVGGHYLEKTLLNYMKFERNINIDIIDCFQYSGLHFHSIIEEDILYKLLESINSKKEIILKYNNKDYRRRRYNDEILKPYKIRYDSSCGRFYLVSFNKNNKCVVSRLDRIKDVSYTNKEFNNNDLKELYKNSMEKSWSSVPKNYKGPCEKLEFRIISSEEYILRKIKNEIGEAEITKEDNTYIVKKEVNDCYEMIPWLRKYLGDIKIISPLWLKKKLNKDFKEMLNNYGFIS